MRYIGEADYYFWEFKDTEEMLRSIWKGEHFIQSNVFFSKKLFEVVGGFDENLHMAEDLDLYIRFLLHSKMPKYVSCVSHLHRVHSGNVSKGVTLEDHKKGIEKLQAKYTDRHL